MIHTGGMGAKRSCENEAGPSTGKKKMCQKAEGVEKGGPGLDYQVQLLMYFARKGYELSKQFPGYSYALGKERTEAGKFDDIVIKFKQNESQPWNYFLLQAKYTTKKITAGQLLSSDNTGAFTLMKYFSTYLNVKKTYEGEGAKGSLVNCVIITNNDFTYVDEAEKQLKPGKAKMKGGDKRAVNFFFTGINAGEVDQILRMGEAPQVKYYQLGNAVHKNDLIQELAREFKENFDTIVGKISGKDIDKEIIANLKDTVQHKEKLEADVEEFLQNLLFMVNLPDRQDIRQIIKDKIGGEFLLLNDNTVDQFNRLLLDYTIDKKQKHFLIGDEIENFFKVAKQIINTLKIQSNYHSKILNCDIDFREVAKNKMNIEEFLQGAIEQILLFRSNTQFLSAVKIQKTLRDLQTGSLKIYTYENSHSFMNFDELNTEIFKRNVIDSFALKSGLNLLIITFDNVDVIQYFLKELSPILDKNKAKKIICITPENTKLEDHESKIWKYEDNDNSFISLVDESKLSLMNRVIQFQGQNIKLGQLYFGSNSNLELNLKAGNSPGVNTPTDLKALSEKDLSIRNSEASRSNLETTDNLLSSFEESNSLPSALEAYNNLELTFDNQDSLKSNLETSSSLRSHLGTANTLRSNIEGSNGLLSTLEPPNNFGLNLDDQNLLRPNLEADYLLSASEADNNLGKDDWLRSNSEAKSSLQRNLKGNNSLRLNLKSANILRSVFERRNNSSTLEARSRSTLDKRNWSSSCLRSNLAANCSLPVDNSLLSALEPSKNLGSTLGNQNGQIPNLEASKNPELNLTTTELNLGPSTNLQANVEANSCMQLNLEALAKDSGLTLEAQDHLGLNLEKFNSSELGLASVIHPESNLEAANGSGSNVVADNSSCSKFESEHNLRPKLEAKNLNLNEKLVNKLTDLEFDNNFASNKGTHLGKINIDAEALENLLLENIEIQRPICLSDLEAAYRRFYKEIRPKDLIEVILDSETSVFVFSGVSQGVKNNLFQILKMADGITGEEIKLIKGCQRILCTSEYQESDFKKYCHTINHNVYWIKIVNNKFNLQQVYHCKFYLKRNFRYSKQVSLRRNIIQNLGLLDDIFVFSNVSSKEDLIKVLELTTYEIKLFEANYDADRIKFFASQDPCLTELPNEIPVHYIEIKATKLIWQKSHYNLSTIRNYIDKDITMSSLNEKDFTEKFINKTTIIIDEPGMGKSTTLAQLSGHHIHSHWIIRINLRTCRNAAANLPLSPEDMTIRSAVKFLVQAVPGLRKSKFLESLLSYKLSDDEKSKFDHKALLLLFDGFDEIPQDETRPKILALLKFVKDKAITWVTARKHEAEILEDALLTMRSNFEDLQPWQHEEFLCSYWEAGSELFINRNNRVNLRSKLKLYAVLLLEKIKQALGNNMGRFMGVPLQLRLLAEGFQDQIALYLLDDNHQIPSFSNLNLLDLYEQFINVKYNIYFREKTDLLLGLGDGVIKSWLVELFTKRHWRLALWEILEDKARECVGRKPPFVLDAEANNIEPDVDQLEELLRVGIVQATNDGHFEFIHRTFAEYFVAVGIHKRFNKYHKRAKMKKLLAEVLIERDYEVIQRLFDKKLNDDTIENWNEKFSCLIMEVYEVNSDFLDLVINVLYHTDYCDDLLEKLYLYNSDIFKNVIEDKEDARMVLSKIQSSDSLIVYWWEILLENYDLDELDNIIESYTDVLGLEGLQGPLKDILDEYPSNYPSDKNSDDESRTSQEWEAYLWHNGHDFELTRIRDELREKYLNSSDNSSNQFEDWSVNSSDQIGNSTDSSENSSN